MCTAAFGCLQVLTFRLHLAETVYSHSLVVGRREMTLNIWDAPYSEVSDTHWLLHDRLLILTDVKVQEQPSNLTNRACRSLFSADLHLNALLRVICG